MKVEGQSVDGCFKGSSYGCLFLIAVGFALVIANMVSSARVEMASLTMIRAAEPVCVAIEVYAERYGRSPSSLEQLVPEFIAELPPCRPAADIGFRYKGGETMHWRLSHWSGGAFGCEYARTSIDEPWYIVGDYDEDYPRERWIAVR